MAGRIALDLKQFKHLKSDKNSHTLQHRDGHVLTLAIKGLSPENQKQLQALCGGGEVRGYAEGGDVQNEETPKSAIGQEIQKQELTRSPNPMRGLDLNTQAPVLPLTSEQDQAHLLQQTQSIVAPPLTQEEQIRLLQGTPAEQQAALDNAAGFVGGGINNIGRQAARLPYSPVVQKGLDRELVEAQKMLISGEAKQKAIADKVAAGREARAAVKAKLKGDVPAQTEGVAAAVPTLKSSGFAEGGAVEEDVPPPAEETAPSFQPSSGPLTVGPSGVNPSANNAPAAPPRLSPEQLQQDSIAQNLAALPPLSSDLNAAAKEEAAAEQALQPASPSSSANKGSEPPGYEDLYKQGYTNTIAGLKGEAKAKQDLAQEQAQILERQIQAKQKAADTFAQQFKSLDDERKAHIMDIQEGHIDPNKYWTGDKNGNGSHSRIMAGIGMLIAGFNPTSNPNAAVQFLQHQMDQNLEAQKANLSSKQNLLAANLRQFGNLKDATEMTRIMQNDVVMNELQKASAKAAAPQAQAELQKAMGAFQTDSMQRAMTLSMRHAMMNLNSQGAPAEESIDAMINMMRMTNPAMAKEMEQRRVPGFGLATVPVPETVRQNIISHQNVDRAMKEVLNFAQKHSGSLDPKIRAQGAAMMNQLQSQIRVAENQGVYKESEAHFMKETMGDNPAHFFAKYQTVPKIKELQHQKHAELGQLLQGYGLKAPQQAAEPQYKTVGGIKYMRGPNGEAIRVK